MGKILYIRLDSSPLPEPSDEIIIKDFNLESYFCTLLGKRLLEEAGLSGAMPYPGKLITDFEKIDGEAYRKIIRQWEKILSLLLLSKEDGNKNYDIEFPISYSQWLNNHVNSEYPKINNIQNTLQKITLNSQIVYEIIHSILLKKLSYFLIKNMEEVKCLVFSIENIGERSYIKHLLSAYNIKVVTLRQSCIFLPYDKVDSSYSSAILKRGETSELFIYGKKVLECAYDEFSDLVNGYARVRKGDKWGTINEEGVEVIPCVYDFIGTFYKETSSKRLLAYACIKNRWGYIDINNEEVIPFNYESINTFQGEYVWAKFNGKWGTIDINNNVRIPFVYEKPGYSGYYGFYDYYFIELNSQKGVIKNDGSIYLPCIFNRIDCDSEFHIIVYKDGRQDLASFYKRNGYLRYSIVWGFINGMAIVRSSSGTTYGFINEAGDEVIRTQYYTKPDTFNKGGVAIVYKDGVYVMIDKSGKEIVPLIYEFISGIGDLHYAKKQGKYGYLNNKGEEVIPFIYDDAGYFNEGVAAVVYNGRKMCIDEKGKTLFFHNYDSVDDYCNGVAVARVDGKIKLIDKQGKEIRSCSYDCDNYVNRVFHKDLLIVSRRGKYGILNLDMEELIPCILDDVSPFSGKEDEYGIIKRNNKYALIKISENGKDITII